MLPSSVTSLPRKYQMKWGWAEVSVVAIALSTLGGCCPDHNDDPDDETLYCNLLADNGKYPTRLTVKGTAQYTADVTGDAVVDGITYWAGKEQLYVSEPTPPFSVTAQMDVGDIFQSTSYGHLVNGSILVRNTFTPADGSAVTVHEQACRGGMAP
jgi:hypothetical protein